MAVYVVFSIVLAIAAIVLNGIKAADDIGDTTDEVKVKARVYGGIIGLFVILSLFFTFYTVNERQVAYTLTFGVPKIVENTGFHAKIPYVTRVVKHDGTTQGLAIGYDEKTNEAIEDDANMITRDFNFLNVDFYVEYRIIDPIEYDFGSNDPEGILYSVSQSSIRNVVGLYDVDFVLTTGKTEVEMKIRDAIVEKLGEHHTGLEIVNVSIQDVEPPTEEVSAAFKAVENSKQAADKALNEAKAYENKQLPEAQAKADQLVKEAEAKKSERENQALQEVAEFNALYEEYARNPEVMKKKLYLEAMEEILPQMEVVIGGEEVKLVIVEGQQN